MPVSYQGNRAGNNYRAIHKKGPLQGPFFMDGAPGEIRTPDRSVRSRVLYPAELQAHNFEGAILRIFASICQRKLKSHQPTYSRCT